LLQQLVHQGGLAMVHVGDNGDIAQAIDHSNLAMTGKMEPAGPGKRRIVPVSARPRPQRPPDGVQHRGVHGRAERVLWCTIPARLTARPGGRTA
jgi:hypothetical protein